MSQKTSVASLSKAQCTVTPDTEQIKILAPSTSQWLLCLMFEFNEAFSWAEAVLFILETDRQSKYTSPAFRNVKKFPKDNKTYLICVRFNALKCVKGVEKCQSGQKFYIWKPKIQARSDFHRDPSGKNVPLMVYTFLSNAQPFLYYFFNHQMGILFMKCLWKWESNCIGQSQA